LIDQQETLALERQTPIICQIDVLDKLGTCVFSSFLYSFSKIIVGIVEKLVRLQKGICGDVSMVERNVLG